MSTHDRVRGILTIEQQQPYNCLAPFFLVRVLQIRFELSEHSSSVAFKKSFAR